MFAFQLWREFKLSISELWSVFPKWKIIYSGKNICIIDNIEKKELLKKLPSMWGIIKAIELFSDYRGDPSVIILAEAEKKEGKFQYGVSNFGWDNDLKKILIKTKKLLKSQKISSRFVNKNFTSLSSAQIIGEGLIKRESDFTIITASGLEYFWKTIWVQDIENYWKRDFGKTRDMQVGMLPPKLAQIMINISKWTRIYDPFCGLWTVLIESVISWNTEVYGSDINPKMVETTKKNIRFTLNNFDTNLKNTDIIKLDARGISSSPLLKKSDVIVTEWYLGQVFQRFSITEKKVIEGKKELLNIYKDFFLWLKKAHYKWVIVISFPFWDIRGKYHYFSEVYDIIKKYCQTEHLLPFHDEIKRTRVGSLLYKRPNQTVGREIFKLKIK